jgi:hypothetical protein
LKAGIPDRQARPSRNSWDPTSASEVTASTYSIRSDQAAGAAKLDNEVAKRLKFRYGVPWRWEKSNQSKGLFCERRSGERQSSAGLGEGWVVKGLVVCQSPQDMEELVHEDTDGLHSGERVLRPPLQLGIELCEIRVKVDQTQAGEIEQCA